MVTGAAALAVVAGAFASGAQAAPQHLADAGRVAHASQATQVVRLPLVIKTIGQLPNGTPEYASPDATLGGLPPSAIEQVYKLSTTSASGRGQIIALIEAFNDPTALSDLNTFSKQFGLPQLATCTSLSQAGACFEQEYPQGKPATNAGWDLEQSLDMEWAHAMAPAAKIMLVDAAGQTNKDLYAGVVYANSLKATEVSMSWGTPETASEASSDKDFTHAGTLYIASSGDSGNPTQYPASSPDVIGVGGTTLNGCDTSCSGFTSETAWSCKNLEFCTGIGGSGGGPSAYEPIPAFQSSYTGPVSGAATIKALTAGKRGTPDVSFDANPGTGVDVYDSTPFQGSKGWFGLGGTSVGAPSWAGILAAGAAAGKTALQGNAAIYGGGYKTSLRDITSGKNGGCGTDCKAGKGYDLVTGLGSPINYP
jgi:subtilase family serine protease